MTRFVSYIAAFGLAIPALAQEPPNVRGRVISPAGAPLAGVEVRLEGTQATARTDERGAFSFVSAPTGYHTLLFRRIGYLPAASPIRVPDTSDTLAVMMLPLTRTLDTVQVVAKLNVLAGIVLDAQNRPVSGAMVDVIGSKTAEATTDEGGWFTFTSVKSGVVVVRARKAGYEMAMHSMRLEDWRGLVLRLDTLESKLRAAKRAELSGIGNSPEYAWKETQQRIASRGARATIVTREELAHFSDMSLSEAVRHSPSGALLATDLQTVGANICVLQDGRFVVGSTTLDMFRTEEVDFVELYPPGTEVSGSVAQYMRGAGCRAVRVPGQARSRGVFYAVVWTR